MNHIENFLKKFRILKNPEFEEKKIVSSILKSELNLDIGLKSISFNGNCAHIKTTPSEKNLIFIKQDRLKQAILTFGLHYINQIR